MINLKIVSQVVASGIPGPAGKSAYQIAVDNGFVGTETEWLNQLLPFKGWYDSQSALQSDISTPSVGDYAYVKGATTSDPVKIYECSTPGTWTDSGRTVDTSTVQTFRSGEAVNAVDITGNSEGIVAGSVKLPTAGAVASALGNAEFSTGEKIKNVGIDDEPIPDSKNLVESGGVTKVYGSVTYQPNYVYVILDNESKLLVGVENNGNVVFGSGVPQQIIDYVTGQIGNLGVDSIVTFLGNLLDGDKTLENILDELNLKVDELGKFDDAAGYIQTIVDSEGKIIEGIDSEGKKIINTKVLFNSNLELQTEEKFTNNRLDFLEVKVDKDNKIIEGITVDGKKYISDFSKETELSIRKLSNVIQIDELNSDFSSPIPVVITGEKGSPEAKYDFILPLNKDAFNIRFRFKITENLLNQNKSAVICKLGNAEIVKASPVPLVQQTSTETYQGQQKTNYWPCLNNGVNLGGGFYKRNNNIGQIAFSIKYSGNETVATVRNTGFEFILNIGDTTYSFSYETYNTVSELYEALKAIENIVVDYRELNNKNCVDLAVFPECNLKPTMYTGITGQSGAPIVEYVDAAEFMIPYAIDDLWHYVEIVKINGVIYSTCDGNTKTVTISDVSNVILTLGGNCDVLFKNLTIHTNSVYDAEYVNGVIISSYNPYVIIYEGHGIDKVPSVEATVSENMNTTIDRLEYVFQLLKDKGYIPISVKDISEWYNGNKELPKRCYTIIFDDFRFDNVMDIDNRSVFTRFNVKPALAIISGMFQTTDIYHNGSVISGDKAVEISTMYDFMLVSHTRNHRYNGAVKPSEMINELRSDIYANEICGVNGLYLVFPYGSSNPYMFWVMNWLGYYLGVNVWNGTFDERDIFNRNKYNLTRYEIGMRESISNIIQGIK